jgi:uncharacterized protein (TIGR02145 family)
MWGGGWRMPTNSEYQSLIDATNKTWMSNYNGSGNNGTLFTDKQDSSKTLFFPAAGYCQEVGNVYEVNRNGSYWSSTHKTESEPNSRASYRLSIRDGECGMGGGKRANGLTVRGVFPY